MRLNNLHKILLMTLVLAMIGTAISCDPNTATNSDTPTEAYKRLYNAVKAGKSEDIKKMLSKDTIGLANSAASRGGKSFEEVIKNGFTQTTFAAKLPAMRDERVKDNYGAVEVFNAEKGAWEDVPFVMEDGVWKLAVGNLFAGTYVRPGKSRSLIERENANAMGKNNLVEYGNGNINMNTMNVMPINKNPGAAADSK